MKIYIRKIDEQCITHQISLRNAVWKEFFDESMEFTAHGLTSGYTEKVEILTATDLRFNSGLNHVIEAEGKLEVNDILVIYKGNTKYDVELIKTNSSKYDCIKELCIRDERHTLLEIDNTNFNEENWKEKFRNWLIKNKYSDSSVTQYINHVALGSKEALERRIIEKDIYNINDYDILVREITRIKEMPEYVSRKSSGNNINEAAFNLYLKFAEENFQKRITGAFNKIYYGIPGSGKSFTVNKEFSKEKGFYIERTTFHPEYTNSDFVGQIIPTVKNGGIDYIFHPGAFTKTLEYALKHKNEKVCLIIEEINRGNASAIFGDIFQLLDRENNINDNPDVVGKSKYTIFNGPILDYLNEKELSLQEVYIPSNMWIVATMNTSDQNVFTLDTAFKRRWKMEYIPNVFANDEKYSKQLREAKIPKTDITWEQFVTIINNKIANDDNTINSEDKQLGMYFVTLEEVQNEKEFAEKILSYIWGDVAKIDVEDWFGNIKTYEELLSSFDKESVKVFNKLFDKYEIHIEETNDEQSNESDTI